MKKGNIVLTIRMAGAYDFQPGKKITIHKRGNLYYASSNQIDFGLVQEAEDDDIEFCSDCFDGVVQCTDIKIKQLKVVCHRQVCCASQ